jgi:biopolymer transport protein ExbB/TolQ
MADSFADTVVINNAQNVGKVLIVILLLVSAAMLALINEQTKQLKMHGRVIKFFHKVGYESRMDMVKAVKQDAGRHDWAQNLRMLSDGDISKVS